MFISIEKMDDGIVLGYDHHGRLRSRLAEQSKEGRRVMHNCFLGEFRRAEDNAQCVRLIYIQNGCCAMFVFGVAPKCFKVLQPQKRAKASQS
jgi:hypothetical protein